MAAVKSGYVSFKGYKTWYEIHGKLSSDSIPLIALHGGPGYTHNHLGNLSTLAERGIPVILYDQLGCGKSDRPDDPKLWTIELYIEELDNLRSSLGLHKIYLLGHSWGGSLAAEYVLTKPSGVEKLILSSPLLDSKLWANDAQLLMDLLPKWASTIMHTHESAETTNTPEYQEAYKEFRKRFICRLDPYPELMQLSDDGSSQQVYETMWGPSETHVTGTLKDWSVLDRLKNITTPTLFLSGRYDEATPLQVEMGQKAVPGAKWVVFENSSHTANLEEPEIYLDTVAGFLLNN